MLSMLGLEIAHSRMKFTISTYNKPTIEIVGLLGLLGLLLIALSYALRPRVSTMNRAGAERTTATMAIHSVAVLTPEAAGAAASSVAGASTAGSAGAAASVSVVAALPPW